MRRVAARHVIWVTVPHVTIAPIARGVGGKVAPGSRYFPYYTRPWIADDDFDPDDDPHITAAEARAVDTAIDLYNEAITDLVGGARDGGRDWYLFDIAGVLDRLASRRYIDDPAARPPWWTPYPLPPPLAALRPEIDSRFLAADGRGGRAAGGLFSLDGVHPTTVAYGLIAQELITIMRLAGVAVHDVDFALAAAPGHARHRPAAEPRPRAEDDRLGRPAPRLDHARVLNPAITASRRLRSRPSNSGCSSPGSSA